MSQTFHSIVVQGLNLVLSRVGFFQFNAMCSYSPLPVFNCFIHIAIKFFKKSIPRSQQVALMGTLIEVISMKFWSNHLLNDSSCYFLEWAMFDGLRQMIIFC